MIKVDKSYTIKFSKGGVLQYATFRESNGVLVRPTLHVSWANINEIPDVTKMTDIKEVLEAIKEFSFCNRAEIYLINHAPIFYDKKKKAQKLIKSMETAYEKFLETELTKFFESELIPLLRKNKWFIGRSHVGYFVPIYKDKNGEYDNIKDDKKGFEFEYLCAKALKAFDLIDSIDISKEHGNYLSVSHKFLNYIYITNYSEFYLEL